MSFNDSNLSVCKLLISSGQSVMERADVLNVLYTCCKFYQMLLYKVSLSTVSAYI